MASVVLRIENQFRELLEGEIFDAEQLRNARAKARRHLNKTFCQVIRRTRIDNYEFWVAVDVAEVESWRRKNEEKNSF